ncbi:MAG: hypothetical protein HKN42_10585 [Granulosicoccus sp.]|nr:hypothetical protein [Granulosicoccus sp.]
MPIMVLAFMPATGLIADMHHVPLAESNYQDWSGSLVQTTLPDTSVLSEYIAHTYSGSTAGASLRLTFAPRFNCSPMMALVVRDPGGDIAASGKRVTLMVDTTRVDFPALIDQDEASLRYSYNADSEEQQKLRALLDVSSRATMQWEMPDGDATEPAEADASARHTVTFSLLGSRLSAQSVERHCKSHVPIPFGE